jgi:uncharacterized Ntn-hydrolase superfamily protein
MTFSIAARCAETGAFALAVSSSSPAVAARCAHVRAGVGAVASQNITDPSLGPRGLDLMERGTSAPEAVAILSRSAPHAEYRQLTAVDAEGRTAHFSGAKTLGLHAAASSENVVTAGNLLANETVPQAMVAAFLEAEGHIAARALTAMRAALEAGGEEGAVHSAGLVVVDRVSWPVTDLRVDWREEDPIGELCRIWELWAPQEEAYVTRALDPDKAPTYGVPGDQ